MIDPNWNKTVVSINILMSLVLSIFVLADPITSSKMLSEVYAILSREFESFFMYGEDIDLSYRIQTSGYKNFYFPKTSIIHYKGESTKKTSVNYIFMFYNAMIIFVKKHYVQTKATPLILIINIAIFLRAFTEFSRTSNP